METSPKLIHNLATGKWLLTTANEYWHIESTSDAMDFARFLQIHIVDQTNSDYLVVITGIVNLKNSDAHMGHFTCIFRPFKKESNPFEKTFERENIDFGIIELMTGFYDDKWVAAQATIGLENIRSLGLRFYLPESSDLGDKTLEFKNGTETFKSEILNRGQLTEIWLDLSAYSTGRHSLNLKAEYKEPNAHDERSLGVMILEHNTNLTDWVSIEDLL